MDDGTFRIGICKMYINGCKFGTVLVTMFSKCELIYWIRLVSKSISNFKFLL